MRTVKQILKRRARLVSFVRTVRAMGSRRARGLAPPRDYARLVGLFDAASGPPRPPVSIRISPLGGHRLALRPGTSDVWVLSDALSAANHLPPTSMTPAVIWDLGCNIGVTLADFAWRFPGARIVGVEPDPASAALARENTRVWAERCRVIEAAVWTSDGRHAFDTTAGFEYGSKLVSGGGVTVSTSTLPTLLAEEERVDFLKMDIEGAEASVLAAGEEWAAKVSCMRVETHAPYSPRECANALGRLGFEVVFDSDPGSRHVTGLRR